MIASIVSCLVLGVTKPAPKVPRGALNLVPTPMHVVRAAGAFRISRSTSVVISDQFPDDRFAAEQLMEEILTDIGERPEATTKPSKRGIALIRLKEPMSNFDQGQGYKLDVTPLKVSVSAFSSSGMFYGVQTLKQLIRANRKLHTIPACHITDWPALKYRGWQHDISRGPIPTYGFLMKEIRILSEYKLNLLTLYTEHVFKLAKHPEIAPTDGITADEIAELSSYAKQFHVELVGNFQSFGHFGNILKVPEYKNLAENPRVLSPAKEESYKFLSDVYSEIAPAYASPFFDINCDEVSGLGEGPSKALVDQIGIGGVYAKHINRVAGLLHAYGKVPMMWGDIALKYPEIVPKLPKDLIVLPWAYDPRPSFDTQILPFTKLGLKFMVCPGVSCWNQIWPDTDRASVNISNFIRDGARNDALGTLNTSWDDDGVNFFDDNWFEFVWGAECSWSPAIAKRNQDPDEVRKLKLVRFNHQFPPVFFGIENSSVTEAYQKLTDLRKNPISGGMKNAAFWRDPLATIAKMPEPEGLAAYLDDTQEVISALRQAKSKATHNAPALDYAIFAARRANYLGESLAAAQSTKSFDLTRVKRLVQQVAELKESYTDLWQRENRSWWLDRNQAKFDDLSAGLNKLLKQR